ncbi:hypothetical protein ABW21_db0202770 [Orbilia brochopaga]|nr:hypothetical protein ABW21_db0202770 [Drechslerella brochopaga]
MPICLLKRYLLCDVCCHNKIQALSTCGERISGGGLKLVLFRVPIRKPSNLFLFSAVHDDFFCPIDIYFSTNCIDCSGPSNRPWTLLSTLTPRNTPPRSRVFASSYASRL